jgi:hypothetical protein
MSAPVLIHTLQLTTLRDQWQQNFATVQGQLGQLSLNTQMILDQQRLAQTLPNHYFVDQSQSPWAESSTNQRQPGFIKPFVSQHNQPTAQNTSSVFNIESASVTARQNGLCHPLLPISAVSLEEETTNLRNVKRKMQPTHSKQMENSHAFTPCTCRKRRIRKQVIRSPFVVSRNETQFHDPSCQFWISGGQEMTVGFGMILCYLILGLKLRLFMQLSIGSGTFSIMPSLSFRRIVTIGSSPAFLLIYSFLNVPPIRRNSRIAIADLTKIFQKHQTSPHDRLEDGSTLLHVSFGLSGFDVECLAKCSKFFCRQVNQAGLKSQSDFAFHRSLLKLLLSYMKSVDMSDTDDNGW